MGVVVIVCYRPREGMEQALLEAVRDHLPSLRAEQLVTDRPPTVMRAEDGTIVEVFEWESEEAIGRAHENQAVLELWRRFELASEYVPLDSLAEAGRPFASFEPVDLEQIVAEARVSQPQRQGQSPAPGQTVNDARSGNESST